MASEPMMSEISVNLLDEAVGVLEHIERELAEVIDTVADATFDHHPELAGEAAELRRLAGQLVRLARVVSLTDDGCGAIPEWPRFLVCPR